MLSKQPTVAIKGIKRDSCGGTTMYLNYVGVHEIYM